MLPDQCSVTEKGRQCVNPPEFIVSIIADGAVGGTNGNHQDEFMVGLTCKKHKLVVSGKIAILQKQGKIQDGIVNFSPVRAVGTDCIHVDVDDDTNSNGNVNDLIQLGKPQKLK